MSPPREPAPPGRAAPRADARSVTPLRWPAESDRRTELAAIGHPRLLVLDPDVAPPLVWDDLEDWVRAPADPVEVQARVRTLEERAAARHPSPDPPAPVVDLDGIVRWGGAWVAVPPIEARLLAVLLAPPGEVARREDLLTAAWPAGVESDRVLDGRIRHLRGRLAPLGLTIRTVRGVGFLLEPVTGE